MTTLPLPKATSPVSSTAPSRCYFRRVSMSLKEDQSTAGVFADQAIKEEVAIQDRMWGDTNERADASRNQLLHAAIAQLDLLNFKLEGYPDAVELAKVVYPNDWDGFRDYGSNVANLVVAAAFIRSEIKRRVLLGEDTERTKRGKPYTKSKPYVSSDVAADQLYK